MPPTRRRGEPAPPGGVTADRDQAEYYLSLLAAQRLVLEIEVVERCTELLKIPLPARKSERARNIRRIIRVKQSEIATLGQLCSALTDRLHPD